ncbi:MAG: hypothetical protein JNG83_00485 [Opitutaceae bacterium]|nr:hypothetical protein [Opitutaceae bacterium]
MRSLLSRPVPIGGVVLAVLLLLNFTGCASDGPGERPRERRKSQPPLAGQQAFFEGLLLAELRLGAGFGQAAEGRMDRPGRSGHEGGRRRGGGGLQMGGGMGGPDGGGYAGGRGPGIGDQDGPRPRPPRGAMGPGAGGPPVMITLRLTNHGSAPVTVAATDFASVLGNFVVLPESLVLEPGQSAAFEPMTSRLGGDYTEVDANLTLKIGDREEKQTIPMRQVPEPAPEAN